MIVKRAIKAGVASVEHASQIDDEGIRLAKERGMGSIQAGRFADIVGVNGDPLADIRELERVSFVMKGSVVYKQK